MAFDHIVIAIVVSIVTVINIVIVVITIIIIYSPFVWTTTSSPVINSLVIYECVSSEISDLQCKVKFSIECRSNFQELGIFIPLNLKQSELLR